MPELEHDPEPDRAAVRLFLHRVRKQARSRGLNFFAVAEPKGKPHLGASVFRAEDTPDGAVRSARKSQIEWDVAHGADPDHDWLKKAEFAAGFMSELAKCAKDADDLLVDGEHAKLTKSQVSDYYLHPKTRGRIIPQLTGRPAMLVQHHPDPVVRRKDKKGAEIMIEEGANGPDNPADYMNWVNQHTVEFHPVHGEEVDHLFVDIDPNGNVPWAKTKDIVRGVSSVLRQEPDVSGVRVVYSGGRGFYVKGKLNQPVATDKARSRLQKILAPIAKEVPSVTMGVPGPSQIRLDVSTLHQKGSLRAEYSINGKTGLVSVPVHDLEHFEKEHATVERVLSKLR